MRFKNLHISGMTTLFANVPSIRTLLFLLFCLSFSTINAQTCDNLTDGGAISGEETGCGSPTFDPGLISSTAPPTGGSGAIEYIWMKTTGDPNAPFNTWQIIQGENGETLEPAPISESTYYGRCARRAGCTEYIGETNFVLKAISCCDINASITSSKSTICPQESVTLSAIGNGSDLTYAWEATGGSFDDATSANPTYSMMMEGTYTIKVTITKGDCMEMAETTITVDNQLPVTITSDHDYVEVNVDLQLNSIVSGNGITYNWTTTRGSFNNNAIANPIYVADTIGSFDIYLEATNAEGCSGIDTFNIDIGFCNFELLGIATDASCDGNDGSITLTPNGGEGTITYQWSDANIGNISNPTNLAAGTYSVTATDDEGCQDSLAIEVASDGGFTLSPNIKLPDCQGDSNGQILIMVNGGVAPYSYNWSGGLPDTNFVNNLAPGTYDLTVTDDAGCQTTGSYTIDNPAALVLTTSKTDPGCGVTNGTATVSVTGGTGSYTYAWNDPANQQSATATNLDGGTYQVIVTDTNGCLDSANVSIVNTSSLVLTTSKTDPDCGLTNGTATVSVSGGTGPFTYLWNDVANQTTATATNLDAATYQVYVSDANGCQDSTSVTLNPGTNNDIVLTTNVINATCANADGAIDLTISGGITPYTINWDNNIGNEEDPTNLVAGLYTVVVTDSTGCGNTTSVIIGSEGGITVTIAQTEISCGGVSDGALTVNATGGTGNYSYAWADNFGPSQTISNLAAGTYTVTTTDANGCQEVTSATLTAPNPLVVDITPSNTDCNNANASAVANVTGGTSGYSYQWNDGNNQTTQTATNLSPGDYIVVVTDDNGCTATDSFTLSANLGLIVTLTTTDALCNGENSGIISTNVANGVAPYSYAWNNFLPDAPGFTGLAQGIYSVTVTDANGCFGTASAKVHSPDPLLYTTVVDSADCEVNDGRARIDVSGGTPGYTYAWGAPLNTNTQMVNGLAAGKYHFTVTDANGCMRNDSIDVFRKTDCDTICIANGGTISTTDSTTICAGDSIADLITVTLTGNIGDSTSWVVTDEAQNILELHASNTFDFDGAGFGTCLIWNVSYTGTINGLVPGQNLSGLSGCQNLSNFIRVIREDCTPDTCIATPSIISTLDATVFCVGDGTPDTVRVNLTVGTGDFSSFVITDTASNILEVSTNTIYDFDTQIPGICLLWNITYQDGLTGLISGNKISDLNGCYKLSNAITIVRQDCRPDCDSFDGSVTINNPAGQNVCAKAAVALSTTPADTSFIYNWIATGGSFDDSTSATPNYTMMMPGTYDIIVTVTKDNCVTKDTTSVTIIEGPSINLTPTDATCGDDNGAINTTVTGGLAPYIYAWSDANIGNDANPDSLAAGAYDVTVTGANGCTATGSAPINNGSDISVTLTPTNSICGDTIGGSIATIVTGGTAPYTYSWSDTNIGNDANPDSLAAGTYDLTVTDADGCSATGSATITNDSDISITLTPINSQCGETNGGSIVTTVTGGTAPYTYIWANTSIGNEANPDSLAPGLYNLTVTDVNGCSAEGSATVIFETGISVTLTPTDADCNGANDGSIATTVAGGTAPYTYAWSDATIGNDANPDSLAAGTYDLTVTDVNGCAAEGSATINAGSNIRVDLRPTDPTCRGIDDGSITASGAGGTAPYTFTWSNGGPDTTTINNLAPGMYGVTVTDANGCTGTGSTTLNAGDSIAVTLTPTNPDCGTTNLGSITAAAVGGLAPYAYIWSNGGPDTSTIDNLVAGTYDVTITDVKGCTGTASTSITSPSGFNIDITNTPTDICPGGSVNFGAIPTDSTITYQWTATGGSFDDATSASPIYTMMMPGTYEIILTATNGVCSDADTTSVTVYEGPSLEMIPTDVTCAGDSTGAISVTASSPNAPLTYLWDNGIGNIEDPTDLPAGTYKLTVTDAAGCKITDSTTIGETSDLRLSLTPTNPDCDGANNGSITANTTGGIAPITFAWSNGAGNIAGISNLAAGTYTVTATDAMGCAKEATATLTQPNPITVTINNPADTICPGTSVNLSVNPVDTALTYSWTTSGGSFDDANSPTPVYTMMMAGTHEIIVVVADGNCTATDTTHVTIGTGIDFTIDSTNVTCGGQSDGSISITINSGTEPISYTWDNGIGNIPNPTGLAAGTYNVTITDDNNCERTASVTIEEANAIDINLTGNTGLCGEGNLGSITAIISGGTIPYSLAWSNGINDTIVIDSLAPGTYKLSVTDGNGCVAVDSVTLIEITPLTAITEAANIGCNESGHAHVTASGGTAPYTYLWSDPAAQTTDTAFNLMAGVYNVTVTDANGCTVTESVTITETDGIICSIIVLNDIETFNGSEGSLSVQVTGGSGNYTYSWNNGGMDSIINNLSINTYIVNITDETGCTCSDTLRLLNPAILGDFVFEDVDSNGIQDAGELGIGGVSLQLTGTTYYGGLLVKNTLTDADGLYQFAVPPGDYKVTVVDAFGYTLTNQNQGGDDALDSDFDPVTNMSQVVTLAENDANLTIDLGVIVSDVCDNILHGGSVRANETICGPNANPAPITNVTFPSGGTGQLEYLWLKSDITSEYYPGHPDWEEIPNSNAPDYDPGIITDTTYYIRCARRRGCNSYPGESNIIMKAVANCLTNPIAENLRTSIIDGGVELTWDGKNPHKSGKYIIQRSTDGVNFKVVSTMDGTETEETEVFHSMDESPNFGENYYRIKTYAPTLSANYSNVAMAMVKPANSEKVLVYPNPVGDEVTIHFIEEIEKTATVEIVNSFGQVLKSVKMDTATKRHQIDISDLSGGIYYLKFDNPSLKRLGQKIYKVEE